MKQYAVVLLLAAAVMCSCHGKQGTGSNDSDTIELAQCPTFCEDSAMQSINTQCAFGPRVTGTEAHRLCGDYIVETFKRYGCTVTEQTAELTAYNGQKLPGRNIIASVNPDNMDRILICAHWDCRPWADNDPDEKNHKTPILAANDAASGVAVMLELARQIQSLQLNFGVDFICFDAEDWGTPQWDEENYPDSHDSWCLGSTYWATNPHKENYEARYGILLDMVGGRGSKFAQESYSLYYAPTVVQMLWHLASQIGYGAFFSMEEGGGVVDDHVPVNQIANIPCIDIIPHFENGPSSFGPTWHTVADTPENIDPAVLKAVGQSVLQLIYNDNLK